MDLTKEQKGVLGRRSVLNTTGVAPNLAPADTQLISARVDKPRQFVVTMQPITKSAADFLPWNSSGVDGITPIYTPPAAPNVFSAASFGSATAVGKFRAKLRWGAAGVAWETQFDYPPFGGVFSLTADLVDLNVGVASGSLVYTSADQVPIVGAHMVEGHCADQNPLRWTEGDLSLAAGQARAWAIKPFARRLLVSSIDAQVGITVEFLDPTLTWSNLAARINSTATARGFVQEIPLPQSSAAVVKVTNLDGANAARVSLVWLIGFA